MLRWMRLTRWVRWVVLSVLGVCLSIGFQWGLGNIGNAQGIQPLAPLSSIRQLLHSTPSPTPLASSLTSSSPIRSSPTPSSSPTPYTFVQSGKEAYDAQRYTAANRQRQQAVEGYAAIGDRTSQAQALALQSFVQQKLGHWDTAQALIDQSLALIDSLSSPPLRIRAQVWNAQGHLYFATGQPQFAFNSWVAAEEDYRATDESSGRIGSQINQIQALESIGAYHQAIQRLDAIETELDTIPDSAIKVSGLLNLGNMLRLRGEVTQSHDRLMTALTIAQSLDLSMMVSPIYLNLGNTERVLAARAVTLNRPTDVQVHRQTALDYYENAIATATAPLNLPLRKIEAQLNQLSVRLDGHRSSGTVATFRTDDVPFITPLISQINEQLPLLVPSRRSVYAQVSFAHSLMRLNDIQSLKDIQRPDVASILERAIAQAQTLQDARAIAYATGTLGRWQEINQEWTAAKQSTSTALQTAQQIQAVDIAYQWQWQMGRIIQAESDTVASLASSPVLDDSLRVTPPSYAIQNLKSPQKNDVFLVNLNLLSRLRRDNKLEAKSQNPTAPAKPEAITYYTESVKTLSSLRSDLVALNPDIQFSFREQVEPVYRELVGLLLRDPNAPQDQLRQARDVIEALQLAELDNFFRDACAQPQSINISTVDPNTAVLYPILLPDTSSGQVRQRLEVVLQLPPEVIASNKETPNGEGTRNPSPSLRLLHVGQTLSEQQVTQVAEALQRGLRTVSTSTGKIKAQSQQLYDWLIRPFEEELERSLARDDSTVKTLAFVLDGSLRNVPMSVLYDGEQYLVERYAIALTPGLQLLDSQPLQRQELNVLLGGAVDAPSFESFAFNRLENVSRELDRISITVADSEVLQNQTFLKNNIQSEIETTPFNVVHLATHGNFSSDPEQTFILDWQQPIFAEEMDALLHINNPQRAIDNPIELLILSACETAAGDSRAALGLAGIAIRAGARSTLATLWQVNDASTAEFMVRFYQELANPVVTKAEALRNVQLSFLKADSRTRYNRPNRWAPFILVGNWR